MSGEDEFLFTTSLLNEDIPGSPLSRGEEGLYRTHEILGPPKGGEVDLLWYHPDCLFAISES